MNKIAQRIRPVMNDAERDAVLDDHYTAEAQALAHGAEASLLKLAALRGTLTPDQSARWTDLRAAHVRALGGGPGRTRSPAPSPRWVCSRTGSRRWSRP